MQDIVSAGIVFLIIGFIGQGLFALDLYFNGFILKKWVKVQFL